MASPAFVQLSPAECAPSTDEGCRSFFQREGFVVVPAVFSDASRRRDCHFTDIPSTSILKRLLKGEGVQQDDSLANG